MADQTNEEPSALELRFASPAPAANNSEPGQAALTQLDALPTSTHDAPTLRAISVKPIAPLPSSAHADSSQAAHSSGAASSTTVLPLRLFKHDLKAFLQAQLPLEPGRQVAFRLSRENNERKEEGWILARVISSINGDKNRYAIEDVDYDPNSPTREEGKFNVTLDSIVPLPDSRTARSRARTYPPRAYQVGTNVMAAFPDTLSFYKAKVVGGPETVLGEKGMERKKVYKLAFEDDNEEIRNVSIDLVVELP